MDIEAKWNRRLLRQAKFIRKRANTLRSFRLMQNMDKTLPESVQRVSSLKIVQPDPREGLMGQPRFKVGQVKPLTSQITSQITKMNTAAASVPTNQVMERALNKGFILHDPTDGAHLPVIGRIRKLIRLYGRAKIK